LRLGLLFPRPSGGEDKRGDNTHYKEQFSAFLDLARKLNQKFSVIPLLQGSLGLKMLVETADITPDDIDIGLPQHLYRFDERWNDLLAFMQGEGYTLEDEHEHCFQKGDREVNFGVNDGIGGIPSLEVFAGIDLCEIPIMETEGVIYKLMTLEQYLKVYSRSLEDNYRSDKTGNKDQPKIDIIKKALNLPE
jgi:phosphoribosylanthranilate isomerase